MASESLGVRSLATYVETPDVRILLDAGASLAPRFGKMPHPLEYKALRAARKRIRAYAAKSDLITITHYHFDHYTQPWDKIDVKYTWSSLPEAEQVYSDKDIGAKHIEEMINYSQKKRGYIFNKVARKFAKKIDFLDERILKFNGTSIEFSRPLSHGEENTPLGYVLAVTIRHDDDALLFGSDIQGPISSNSMKYLLSKKPTIMLLSGPPIYLSGTKVEKQSVDRGMKNMLKLAGRIKSIIVDHHLLRTEEPSLSFLEQLKKEGKRHKNKVCTFAEFLDRKNELLEARREQLYQKHPVGREFLKWANAAKRNQTNDLPPL